MMKRGTKVIITKSLITLFLISISLIFLTGFVGALTINQFNNSLTTENLTFTGNENITRYLNIPKNASVASAFLNLSGFLSEEGTYTGDSFDIAAQSIFPEGITNNDTFIWVADDFTNEVYKYDVDGTYTGDSFDTGVSGNTALSGITNNNTFIWTADRSSANGGIYKYYMNGTYTGEYFDTRVNGNSNPKGITNNKKSVD